MESTQYSRLRAVFQHVLALAAASCTSGCIRAEDFTTNLCSAEGVYEPLRGITTATSVDYISLRRTATMPDGTSYSLATSSTGTPCAGSVDVLACEARLSATISTLGWNYGQRGAPEYLVYTRGDEITVVNTVPELNALLSPVETAADAALLAHVRDHYIPCEGNNARVTDNGIELRTETGFACGAGTHRDANVVHVSPDGTFTVQQTVVVEYGQPGCAVGRMTDGLALSNCPQVEAIGDYLARVAELEAAAVQAFERMVRELKHHGAPSALVQAAEQAVGEEISHAEQMGFQAHRFRGRAPAVSHQPLAVRELFAIALENAVEGCVRETFGALQAWHQAEFAKDPALRALFRTIAEDETRHAAISWQLAQWAETQCTPAQREALQTAQQQALLALTEELGLSPSKQVQELAGVPSGLVAQQLLGALQRQLWS